MILFISCFPFATCKDQFYQNIPGLQHVSQGPDLIFVMQILGFSYHIIILIDFSSLFVNWCKAAGDIRSSVSLLSGLRQVL